MLAHVDQTTHVHPHPAGAGWELLALLAVLVACTLITVVLALRARSVAEADEEGGSEVRRVG